MQARADNVPVHKELLLRRLSIVITRLRFLFFNPFLHGGKLVPSGKDLTLNMRYGLVDQYDGKIWRSLCNSTSCMESSYQTQRRVLIFGPVPQERGQAALGYRRGVKHSTMIH